MLQTYIFFWLLFATGLVLDIVLKKKGIKVFIGPEPGQLLMMFSGSVICIWSLVVIAGWFATL